MKTSALLHFPGLAILQVLAWLVGASPILTSDALAVRDPSTSILTPTLVIRQDPSDSSSPSDDPTASSTGTGTVGDSSTGDASTTAPQQPVANPQQTSGTNPQQTSGTGHLNLWQILRHPIKAAKVGVNKIKLAFAKMHLDERQKNFPSDTASIAALQAKIKKYQDKVAKHKSHMT